MRKGAPREGEEVRVARIATLALGAVAVLLGITFKGQNVAFMVGLAFAIAASANFPALVLSIFWRRCTTNGVVASMLFGTFGTLFLIYLSPVVQVDILHRAAAIFPLRNPGIVTIPGSFLLCFIISMLSKDDGGDGPLRLQRARHGVGTDPALAAAGRGRWAAC